MRRTALTESITQWISRHGAKLARRGTSYVDAVQQIQWDGAMRRFRCLVQGSAWHPYEVTIELRRDKFMVQSAVCDCPYSEQSRACKHTYAALYRICQEILYGDEDWLAAHIFSTAVASKPGWKRLVEHIDAYVAAPSESQVVKKSSSTRTRLTWRIQFSTSDGYVRFEIVPCLQTQSAKTGKWTKGRKIRPERLVREPELIADQPSRELAAIVAKNSLGYNYWYGTTDALDETKHVVPLIGHPLVFWDDEPSQQIDICRGQLGVTLYELSGGAWAVHPAVDGLSGTDGAVLVPVNSDDFCGIIRIDRSQNLIAVAGGDSATLELFKQIVEIGEPIPNADVEHVLRCLESVHARLPVTFPEKLLAGTIEPDRRTVLRLTPASSAGLSAELLAQPAAGAATFQPGSGSADLTTLVDGKRMLVRREFDEEIHRAEAISVDLALDEDQKRDRWTWDIDDDQAALDLVAAAEDRQGDDLIVTWPDGDRIWISKEVTPQALRVQVEDGKDWFGLKGTIDVDGQSVALAALLESLRQGNRYVPIGKNRWMRISSAFRERLAALADVVHPTRSGLELDITAAPVLDDLVDDEATLRACRAWRESMKRLESAGRLNPEPPITLSAELRDYQLDGYRWLRRLAEWGVGGCLADDMGLGKTVQTLAVLLDRVEEGPALVVAPTSVGDNWARETERFAPTLRAVLYRESDRSEILDTVGDGDVLIISYGLLLRDAEKLANVTWGTFVLDEAQKIKNSQTKTSRAARGIEARWKVALTGTPMENHLGELWSIFRVVCPGLFGSWDRFRERFAAPIERDRDPARRHALARTVRPFILRRSKAEVLDELPDRTEVRHVAELSEKERKLYEDARLQAVAQLATATADPQQDRRFEVLAALTRLRQLACHPRLLDASWKESSAKLDTLLEIVDQLREGHHRALVFSQFTQHLALIREALDERGVTYQYLDGQTPAAARTKRVDAFQKGEGELFLISLKAGGTGLNLTAADYVIHMDPWWNPAVEDQATDRAHRIGQTRPVTVYRIVAKDTIEEQILAMHADKRQLVSGVLDGTDRAGKLSTEELVSLIRGRDAIAGPSDPEPKTNGQAVGGTKKGRPRRLANSTNR